MDINLNMYQTLAAAVAVFFLGGFLKTKIKFLRKYCIPAPVIGGTIFSIINCILYTKGLWTYSQDTVMQNWCMMLFFTSIGYMASVKLIKKGGILVIKMAVLVGILIIIQNCIGISLSHVFHENPLMGLADGSIPLVGGHGTSGSFGPVLEKLGLPDATTIAFAAATFGLVAGSFIGGPIGELLIRHFHLFSTETDESSSTLDGGKINKHPETEDDEDAAANYLNMDNFMYAFGQLLLAMGLGTYVSQFFVDIGLVFPGYIGAMIVAAVIRNVAEGTKLFGIYQKESEVLGGYVPQYLPFLRPHEPEALAAGRPGGAPHRHPSHSDCSNGPLCVFRHFPCHGQKLRSRCHGFRHLWIRYGCHAKRHRQHECHV